MGRRQSIYVDSFGHANPVPDIYTAWHRRECFAFQVTVKILNGDESAVLVDALAELVEQARFVIDPPGRSLGIDALAWRREGKSRDSSPMLSLVA